jgi:anti-sigma factor RsiW
MADPEFRPGPTLSLLDQLARGPRGCCSDLDLDRLILGELDADAAATLRRHLETSPSCQARHDAMRAEHEAWQRDLPPLSGAVVVGLDGARRRRWLRLSSAAGVMLAAAGVLIAVGRSGPDPEVVRPKGGSLRATFALDGGADVFDGDTVTVPATVRVTAISGVDGVVAVDIVTDGVTDGVVVGPHAPVTAAVSTTLTVTLPVTTAPAASLRVLACDSVSSLTAHRKTPAVDDGCSVDTITLVLTTAASAVQPR